MKALLSAPTRISALVTDVDGTLLTRDKVLTDGARTAVARLQACGIKVALISSRPPRGLRNLIASLRISTPFASFNGGLIATPEGRTVNEHILAPAVARSTVRLLEEQRVQVWVFSGEDWFLRDRNGSRVSLEERTVGFPPTIVADLGAALDAAGKIVGVSADPLHLAACERSIRAALGGSASVIRSQPYYLDITHPSANKGEGLVRLAELLAVPLNEVVVIGDGANDVAMFAKSGLSIAMGNAASDVRAQADLLTDSCDNEGFAKAVENFILSRMRSAPAL